MNTNHDENKIKEMTESYCRYFDFEYDSEQALEHTKDLKEYAEYIRNKTIDECIACVPDEQIKKKLTTHEQSWYKVDGYNTCREQTITNLNNLKNNEQ